MILLFGGTSESVVLARAMAEAGLDVLFSTATDIPIDLAENGRVRRRCGRLDREGIQSCIDKHAAQAVVDAAHPYAVELHENASGAAARASLPYFRLMRPAAGETLGPVQSVRDHDEAARVAFAAGRPVLLTTGSRNLGPYVQKSEATRIPITVRVLPHSDSVQACIDAGVPEEGIIQARGPFSVEENRRVISEHSIGVLVTKDSGPEGGVFEKVEAARAEGCAVVLIARPDAGTSHVFNSIPALMEALLPAARPISGGAGNEQAGETRKEVM